MMIRNNIRWTRIGLLLMLTSFLISCSEDESSENSIFELLVNTEVSQLNAQIDEASSSISLRVPESVLTSNVEVQVGFSPLATLTPDFTTAVDLSSISEITVTAEDGSIRTYTLNVTAMNEPAGFSYLGGVQATKWFGGDNRSDIGPRNVGTGQRISINETMHVTSFQAVFLGAFDFFENPTGQGQEVNITLDIRDALGEVQATTSTVVAPDFVAGVITWDLSDRSIVLQEGADYIFTWYLPDGFTAGLTSGSVADGNAGFTEGSGYNVTVTDASASVEDWSKWMEHEWDFWFGLGAFR